MATAYDTRGNRSGYSNEVNELIDFKAPEVPVKFTVTVIPAPQAISLIVGFGGLGVVRAAFAPASLFILLRGYQVGDEVDPFDQPLLGAFPLGEVGTCMKTHFLPVKTVLAHPLPYLDGPIES